MSGKRYGVILADPPWSYNNSGISGAAQKHYQTMGIDDICRLPILDVVADDAVLILWSVWPLLDQAFSVIEAWGFTYKTGMPWIKLNGIPSTSLFGEVVMTAYPGQGWWVRGTSEPLLICVRGSARPPEHPPVGLISERMRHSKKPSNAHEYAELFPGPYLELFARRTRPGWDVWGNEVKSDVIMEVV